MGGDGHEGAWNLIPVTNFQEAECDDSSWTRSPSPQNPPVPHPLVLPLFLPCFHPFIQILLRFRRAVENLCGRDVSRQQTTPSSSKAKRTPRQGGLPASPLPFSVVKT